MRSPSPLALLLVHVLVGMLGVSAHLSIAPPASANPETDTDPVGVWPLRPTPEVVRAFEPPAHDYGAGHRGVDLAGTPGQGVVAALPGTVRFAGPLAGRGVVVVDHGGTRTTYEPVTADVEVGESVRAGDRIGALESVLSHCAPHACLHWGWIAGETYLDPLRLVGVGPVRLLPLWGGAPVDTGASPGAERGVSTRVGPLLGWLTPAGAPVGRHGGDDRW